MRTSGYRGECKQNGMGFLPHRITGVCRFAIRRGCLGCSDVKIFANDTVTKNRIALRRLDMPLRSFGR